MYSCVGGNPSQRFNDWFIRQDILLDDVIEIAETEKAKSVVKILKQLKANGAVKCCDIDPADSLDLVRYVFYLLRNLDKSHL